jgi:hypothetical protein
LNDTPMTTPDRPIVVRGAVAHVRSGVAAYGGNPASFDRPLPAGAVAVVPQTVGTLDSSHRSQGVADVGACSGLNGGSMDVGHAAHADNAGTAGSVHDDSVKDGGAHRSSASARPALWRIDVSAELTQPEGRAAAFQEQDTFEPDCSLSVALDATSSLEGNALPGGDILALYQHKEWWMRPTWRDSLDGLPARTQMALWRGGDRLWRVLVMACDGDMRADLCSRDGRLCLQMSTNCAGRIALHGVAGYAAVGADPYEAIHACAQATAQQLGIRMRPQRPFPEALTGLGWCTWDSLGQDVDEASIIAKMEEFKEQRVPISWVLIDDGWSNVDRESQRLAAFEADRARFPKGIGHTAQLLKSRYGVRSVGVWQAFQGYWAGIDPRGGAAAAAGDALSATANGCLIPSERADRSYRFWDAWDRALRAAGIDFVKVDSQSSTTAMTRGVQGYGQATWGRHAGLDAVAAQQFDGALINCMGMAPENYWHRPTSPVTRTSDDYLPHEPQSLAEHVMQNAYCALLMGELYHCDWDMFWTRHPHARVHAALRALSGGPVYCSDALGRTDPAVLRGIALADGTVPRPDDACRPLPGSLLEDPTLSLQVLGVANRFGRWQVMVFIGLRPGGKQVAVVEAQAASRWVVDLDGRRAVRLNPGEAVSYDIDYGQMKTLYGIDAFDVADSVGGLGGCEGFDAATRDCVDGCGAVDGAAGDTQSIGIEPLGLIDVLGAPATVLACKRNDGSRSDDDRRGRDGRHDGSCNGIANPAALTVTLAQPGTFAFLDPERRCTAVQLDDGSNLAYERHGALCVVPDSPATSLTLCL